MLTFMLGAGAFGMVALYNTTVNLGHNISDAKAELDRVGAETTRLSNQTVAILGDVGIAAAAARDGLIEDQKPQYFQISQTRQTWPIASQR